MLRGSATVCEALRSADGAPRCSAGYGDIFFAVLAQLSPLSRGHLPPASICCSILVRDHWPGEAVLCSGTRASPGHGADPKSCRGGGRSSRVQRAASHAEAQPQCCMGWIYSGFLPHILHRSLLEAHDSIREVCISMFTLALPSSQHLVPKETCREMSNSRYSAAEQFAIA